MTSDNLLSLCNLSIAYLAPVPLFAVQSVSLDVRKNEVLGLVGESGSGKSTLSMAILGHLPRPGRIMEGSIVFEGRDLATANSRQWREVRWRKLSYIPQGAMNALNPVLCIRTQFYDIIRAHEGRRPSSDDERKLVELLANVRLPESALHAYPHELSGGMKQRVCIAMSIFLKPKLIVADEPTSALDVITQRVVLETLLEARRQLGASLILVGHDLALQAQVAHRVAIMFAGRVVEVGPVSTIFSKPYHTYTRRLIASVPSIRTRTGMLDMDDEVGNPDILPNARLKRVGSDHYAIPG